jgi:hypothetical protein
MDEARRAGNKHTAIAVPASSRITPTMIPGSFEVSPVEVCRVQLDNMRDSA